MKNNETIWIIYHVLIAFIKTLVCFPFWFVFTTISFVAYFLYSICEALTPEIEIGNLNPIWTYKIVKEKNLQDFHKWTGKRINK
jgi:hypothetical protein